MRNVQCPLQHLLSKCCHCICAYMWNWPKEYQKSKNMFLCLEEET